MISAFNAFNFKGLILIIIFFFCFSTDVRHDNITDEEWRLYLSKFLFSNNGGKYQANFKFEKKLKCGELASNVTVRIIK